MTAIPATMRAVVIHGPHSVKVETIPVPKIDKATDVLIKVHLAGLCGAFVSPASGMLGVPSSTTPTGLSHGLVLCCPLC
jgi:threonine dehydrogenase-like Zn-dependent dehydrogenase